MTEAPIPTPGAGGLSRRNVVMLGLLAMVLTDLAILYLYQRHLAQVLDVQRQSQDRMRADAQAAWAQERSERRAAEVIPFPSAGNGASAPPVAAAQHSAPAPALDPLPAPAHPGLVFHPTAGGGLVREDGTPVNPAAPMPPVDPEAA